MQVSGQITVTQVEPRRFAEADHLVQRPEALVAESPAPILVYPPSERVADGVEVGGHVKPPDHGIVARVTDDGEAPRGNERVQAPKKLGGACPAGEGNDAHEAVS